MELLLGEALDLYLQMHIFCICLLLLIGAAYVKNGWRKRMDPKGRLAAINVFYAISLTALLFISTLRAGDGGKGIGYFFSDLWFISISLSSLFWFMFIEETARENQITPLPVKLFWLVPIVASAAIVVTTPLTGLMYSIGTNGTYERGILFYAVVFIHYFQLLCAAIRAFINSRKTAYTDRKKLFFIFGLSPLPLLLASVMKLIWNVEVSCVFHTLSIAIIYLFIVSDIEMKQNEYINSLAEDFSAVFSIDVAKNTIHIISVKDPLFFDKKAKNKSAAYDDFINELIDQYIEESAKAEARRLLDAGTICNRLQTEKNFYFDYHITSADGAAKVYRVKFARNEAEKAKNFILAVQNIDEETRSAQRRDEILKGVAEDYDCILYIDIERNTLEESYVLNPRFNDIMPKWTSMEDFEKAFEQFISDHVAADDRERFKSANQGTTVMEALNTNLSYTCNFKMVLDGAIIYYQLKYTAKKQNGKIVGIVLGFRNVDGEKKRELQREVENGIKSDILNVLAYDYLILLFGNINNTTYNVVYLSEKIKSAEAGLISSENSIQEAYEKYIIKYVHPEERDVVRQALTTEEIRRRLTGHKRYTIVLRCLLEGEYKYAEMVVVKSEERYSEPVNVAIGISQIDSEYRNKLEQEKQLKNALARADAANDAKSTFLFNMSHDIRTPLNAITGFTELAKANTDDPVKIAEYLEKISLSGNHLLKLVNEILDMSRVEAGKINTDPVPVVITELVKNIVTICTESARKNSLLLTLKTTGVSKRTVLADELHVNKILMNILSNAIKYTPAGGSVLFTVKELNSDTIGYAKYRFSIEDTGRGMSEEYLEHIFEFFSRERNTTVSGIEGTGLGMAIVKRLVDFMEGTIDIKSKPGVGTRVNVVLQFPVQTIHNIAGEETKEEDISLENKKALVVEDNDMNREIVCEIMKANGVTPTEAANGKIAVDTVKKLGTDAFDFILMDIQMPVMNGYDATAEIRKLPGGDKLSIIALSANAFEEDRIKSLDAGMDAHVAKPINVKELIKTMKELSTID